jgi:leucyl/phenylalanyl-tRNA---protein transferase
MFHTERDASKAALVALVRMLEPERASAAAKAPLAEPSQRLLDVQWRTDHLATLGVVDVPRSEYVARLEVALRLPLPEAFG